MSILNIAEGASQRWEARQDTRTSNREKMDAGRAVETETPERLQLRLNRLAEGAIKSATENKLFGKRVSPVSRETSMLVETIGLERVIGKADYFGINYLELALSVARFVGRINIRSSPARTLGFGTGFMVSPRLLMTNNHVLSKPEDALYSEVEFDYQNDREGRLLPVVTFALDPHTFFLTNEELDYALVAVRERSICGLEIKRYGWSRLIGSQGKAILGESLNIIQHPKGDPKQIVLHSNQLVDLFDQFIHYVGDTDRGSSGAPVYNDQWELVALHHSGVPKKDVNGNFLAKDGSIWHNGMDPDKLEWVANEGIRVSSLVEDIRKQPLATPAQERLRNDLLNLEPASPMEAARLAAEPIKSAAGSGFLKQDATRLQPDQTSTGTEQIDTQTWTIPLEVTIRLGTPTIPLKPGQVSSPAISLPRVEPSGAKPSPRPDSLSLELREALAELQAVKTREYYNESADQKNRDSYYKEITPSENAGSFYDLLSEHLKNTHTKQFPYRPAMHVYPWVDLREMQPSPVLQSIYSGKSFDPKEFIEADFQTDQQREKLYESIMREAALDEAGEQAGIDFLEASLPYNCEHVVPQSWFGKREPMRGDLHHLFACESGCNSFRGNIPYFDFPDFEEALRNDCGKREEGRFEPSAGKGVVARATLYFLLRYPKEINRTAKEYTEDRIHVLLDWHTSFVVTRYEKHRNAAIFEKQGNRNPLIDYPEWGTQIDFMRGLG